MIGVLTLLRSNKRMLGLATVFTALVILFELQWGFIVWYIALGWSIFSLNGWARFWSGQTDVPIEKLVYSLVRYGGTMGAVFVGLLLLPQVLYPLVNTISDNPDSSTQRYYLAVWVLAIAWSCERLYSHDLRKKQLFCLEVMLAGVKAGQLSSRYVNFNTEFDAPILLDSVTQRYLRMKVFGMMIVASIVMTLLILISVVLAYDAGLHALVLTSIMLIAITVRVGMIGYMAQRLVWKQGRMSYYCPFDQSLAGGGHTGF